MRRIRWLVATETAFQGLANIDAILSTAAVDSQGDSRERYVTSLIEFIAGGLQYGAQLKHQPERVK